MKATHAGWFLFCPVLLDMTDAECPEIWARWEILEPLLSLAHYCQSAMIGFLSMCNADYEPAFVVTISREIA